MKAWRIYVFSAFVLILIGTAMSFLADKGHLLKWLSGHRFTAADYYFYHVTKLGEPLGFIIIGVMLWFRSWHRMITILILGGIVTLVSYLLKLYFAYERPMIYLNRTGWDGPLQVLDYQILSGYHSFPSGHSMAAWALFTLTAALIRKTWVSFICLFLAVSVSISRVYLMVHFQQDVVAGAAIGFTLGYMIYYVFNLWMKRISPPQTIEPEVNVSSEVNS